MHKAILSGKKVLITGATGFMGSVLLRRLIVEHKKAKAYIFLRETSDPWRIKDLLKKTNIQQVDLVNSAQVKKVVGKIRPNVIFHLAAYGAYPHQNDLEVAVQTNILGTMNLLGALGPFSYDLFINTGSSSEYGYKRSPMRETDLLEPASYYAATKASVTLLANTYGELNRKPVLTLRPFSVYGPYEEPGRFIPTAILQAINNETINVVQGPVRDFVYVEDFVDACLLCLSLKNYRERVFNICSGKQTPIIETARLIIEIAGSQSKIKVGNYKERPWDTNFWIGSNSQAEKVLKWKPKYSLKRGLSESIKWFRENRNLYAKK